MITFKSILYIYIYIYPSNTDYCIDVSAINISIIYIYIYQYYDDTPLYISNDITIIKSLVYDVYHIDTYNTDIYIYIHCIYIY